MGRIYNWRTANTGGSTVQDEGILPHVLVAGRDARTHIRSRPRRLRVDRAALLRRAAGSGGHAADGCVVVVVLLLLLAAQQSRGAVGVGEG